MAMKPSAKVIAKKEGVGSKSVPKAVSVTRATVSDGRTDKSVDIRKIENGFIVRESSCGPKGYKSTERYVAKAPIIKIDGSKAKK